MDELFGPLPAWDWADFLAPLHPTTVAMALVLGIGMGMIARAYGRKPIGHLYWPIMGGAVFFIPLTIIRWLQAADVFERFLAVGVLWVVFCVAMDLGARIVRR